MSFPAISITFIFLIISSAKTIHVDLFYLLIIIITMTWLAH